MQNLQLRLFDLQPSEKFIVNDQLNKIIESLLQSSAQIPNENLNRYGLYPKKRKT